MNNKYHKIISIIVLIILLLVGIVGVIAFCNIDNKKTVVKEKKEVKEDKKKDKLKEEEVLYQNNLPSEREFYNNSNIMGRLEIPGVNINSLVTRTDNNTYYLTYNIYNQEDNLGVPFFDYRNVDLDNDKRINIYGHNTKNEQFMDSLPFINLESYLDSNVFHNSKDVYLSIDSKQIKYEVVAVKVTMSIEHMNLQFNSDEEYLKHLDKLLSNDLYIKDDIKYGAKDKFLVLQVCHYEPENSYLLIICQEKK